jgi:SAM-dependent methyltransferase
MKGRGDMADCAAEGPLEVIRRTELSRVREWFSPGMRVLEIGGGNGYQAAIIAAWGCRIASIDIASRPTPATLYYPIITYDGHNIPFASSSFDRVFSSSVLEHVRHLPALLSEIRRVLKPNGLAIHILPTPSRRFWTSVAHYGYLLLYILRHQPKSLRVERPPTASTLIQRRGVMYLLRRALFAGPHGEYPSAISELYYFSKRRWFRVFETNGFEVQHYDTNGLFYTGYLLFEGQSVASMQALARYLGSSCHIFVTRAIPVAA